MVGGIKMTGQRSLLCATRRRTGCYTTCQPALAWLKLWNRRCSSRTACNLTSPNSRIRAKLGDTPTYSSHPTPPLKCPQQFCNTSLFDESNENVDKVSTEDRLGWHASMKMRLCQCAVSQIMWCSVRSHVAFCKTTCHVHVSEGVSEVEGGTGSDV